ncbi:uncharacterized protein [Ptychodera flava]|uniref:uncharacterized protein n=1 Tax=Ptychodera flava TaxID=63121 RepID=UPI00396A8201
MQQSQPAVPTYQVGQYQQPLLQTPRQEQGSRFSHKAAAGIGITQIILGVASIVAGTVAVCEECAMNVAGTGIWCGLFTIVTGALGCLSARKKSIGPIVASMVMSIINASVFCPIMLSLNVLAITIYYYDGEPCNAVVLIMVIAAFLSATLAIINAVFCCIGCCGMRRAAPQIIYVTTQEGAMGATNMIYSVQGVQPSGTVYRTPATAQNMYTNSFPTSQQLLTAQSPPAYQMKGGFTMEQTVQAVPSYPAAPPYGQTVKT